jgi:PPOX class probable F420-dependent enzyme
MTRSDAMDFLRTHRQVALSTLGPDGWPHTVPVTYALIEDRLVMTAKRRSQKVVNLTRDRRVSGLVEDGETYDTRRGVLVIGTAEVIPDDGLALRVIEAILAGDPVAAGAIPLDPSQIAQNRSAVFVTPLRLVSWDHTAIA